MMGPPGRILVALLAVAVLLGLSKLAWGQFANKTSNVVGTLGGACTSSLNDYAWPDTNGNILKCVANVWTPVAIVWSNANTRVGIGSSSPVVTLDLSQRTDALALPVGTTGQEPASPFNGMIRYNTTLGDIEAYIAGAWTTLTTGGSSAAITLGTSANTPDPYSSFSATTGLFSPASGTVGVTSAGTEMMRMNATGVGIGTTSPQVALDVRGQAQDTLSDSATNTISYPLMLNHLTTGTSAASFGSGIKTQLQDGTGALVDASELNTTFTTATGSEFTQFAVKLINNGTLQNSLTLSGGGNLTVTGNILAAASGVIGFNGRGSLTSPAAGEIQLGAADVASPVAQTLQVQNVVAGTTNTAGANFTINGSAGTGTSAGGALMFETAPAGTASGSSQNAQVEAMRITSAGQVGIGTATPAFPLDVYAGSNLTPARFWNASSNNRTMIEIENGSVTHTRYIGTDSSTNFNIYESDASTIAVAVSNSGSVGIGTTSPQSLLHVNGGEVQIGSSGASCAPNNAGALRYSGGSLTYCNSSSWTAPTAAAAGSTGQIQFNNGGAMNADSNLFWDNTNKRLGIGGTAPIGQFHLSGGNSATAWTTNGIGIRQDAATYTDTSSSGTVTKVYVDRIGTPTLAASSTTTFSTAVTLDVDAPPSAGSNVTITNPYAMMINGNSVFGAYNLFGGPYTSPATPASIISIAPVASAVSAASWSTTGLMFSSNSATLTDTTGSGSVGTRVANSFLTPTFASVGTETVTTGATLFVQNAPTAGTNMTITQPLALDVANGNVEFNTGWLGIGTYPVAVLNLGGTISTAAWLTSGIAIRENGATYTDTSSSGTTNSNIYINRIGTPTIAASSSATYNSAATFEIDAPPTAGTNATLTNPYSLYVATGSTFLGGMTSIGGVTANGPLSMVYIKPSGGALSAASWTTAGLMFDSDVATLTDNTGSGAIGTRAANSFLTPTFAAVGTETITNAATVYISNAPTAGSNTTITNAAALFVASGASIHAGFSGFGTTSAPTAIITTGGNQSAAAWTTSGINIRENNATYTDTTSSGTVGSNLVNRIGTPTLAASSTTTYTAAATFEIDAAPSAGTNVTITNPLALYVGGNSNLAGLTSFGGAAGTPATSVVTIFPSGGALSAASWTTTGLLFGSVAATLTDTSGSGTITNRVANSFAAPTLAASSTETVTNAATLYVSGAPSAGTNMTITNPLALEVAAGAAYFGGNVGIGITAPTESLDVYGAETLYGSYRAGIHVAYNNSTGSAGIAIENTGPAAVNTQAAIQYLMNRTTGGQSNGDAIVGTVQDAGNTTFSTDLSFQTATNNSLTTKLYIDKAGNVGVGTSAPAYLLHVGSGSASGIVAEFQNSAGACTLTPSASSMSPSCTSDIRLKTDVRDTGDALSWLDDMRVRDFTIKATGDGKTGVIAQEMLSRHPDMVHMGQNGFYSVEEPNIWRLVKAIQQLKAENEAEAHEIISLRNELADLRREGRTH